MKSILAISNLCIERSNTRILGDLSWKIQKGEHWVILGSNGSGKTSLLSALTGYLTPTAGEVEVLGERFGQSDWRELRKRIGLVSSSIRQLIPEQEPALETVVSGKYAMIDYWGRIKPEDRLEALAILEENGCAHLAERPWRVLSQGERQRVLIARALMGHPRLLILDEPCAGLDPVAREHFLEFIQLLGSKRQSPTLVLVTHHVEEIMPIFSHVLLIRDGTVLACGEKARTLNSRNLEAAFGHPMRLSSRSGRYLLRISRA